MTSTYVYCTIALLFIAETYFRFWVMYIVVPRLMHVDASFEVGKGARGTAACLLTSEFH